MGDDRGRAGAVVKRCDQPAHIPRWRCLSALAVAGAVGVAGCGISAPSTNSLPLADSVQVVESGLGAGPPLNSTDPGKFRFMFIAESGVSSEQLLAREEARLRAAGWKAITHFRGKAFSSQAQQLSVAFVTIADLGDADGQSEGDTGLYITRAVREALDAHDGMLFVTFANTKLFDST